MKISLIVSIVLSLTIGSQALTCWICENASSNNDCRRRGRSQLCQENEEACQTEVRRGSFGMLITKRCKQAVACDNNFVQNPRAAWSPSQCNTRTPSSVCRCCCNTDFCNRDTLNCLDPRRDDGTLCDTIGTPANGKKDCFSRSEQLPSGIAVVEIGTECRFSCNRGYSLVGDVASTCDMDQFEGTAVFNRPVPECRRVSCGVLSGPNNGAISCTRENNVGSRCSYRCQTARGFELFPPQSRVLTCLNSGSWNRRPPCCALSCPPFAVMDMILVLDSSSSIGRNNWLTLTSFVRSFIESFSFTTNFSRLGVIRYNRVVDTGSEILLNSYVNNQPGLLSAFDRIPYDGSGTNTGLALEYVNQELLKPGNGNRPGVQDILIVITDGRAQDEDLLKTESDRLQQRGVITYAVGIEPPVGRLDRGQLLTIAGGNAKRVLVAEGGFAGLGDLLRTDLSREVCENRCS